MSQVGEKIDEYKLLNLIATTNTAQIWEVEEQGSRSRLCLKLLLPEAMADSTELQLIKYEAKVGKSLDHPNCIRVQDVVVTREHAYLIMELFRAPTLKNWIANDLCGLQARFQKVAEGSCAALGHLHDKGWVHKDIKPDNLLLNRDGNLRLIDYSVSSKAAGGLSKLIGRKTKHIQGTRSYIPPEIIRKKVPTAQADIYSLGCTFFEVLTGKVPFSASSPNDLLHRHLNDKPRPPSSLNPNVTPEADRLIIWMMAKEPTDRPKTMQQLQGEFLSTTIFKEPVVEESPVTETKPAEKKASPKAIAPVKPAPAATPKEQPRSNPPVAEKKSPAVPQENRKPSVPPASASKPVEKKVGQQKQTPAGPSKPAKETEAKSSSGKAVDIQQTKKGSSMFRLVFDEEEQQGTSTSKPAGDNLLDFSSLEDAESAAETEEKKKDDSDDDDLEFMDELPPIV